MADFSDEIATAKELIAENGALCTWRKRAGATYNIPICFVSQGSTVGITEALGADGSIPRGQYDALMGVHGFKPEQGDTVIRANGDKIMVGPIGELSPADDPILYFIKFKV